MSSIPLFSTIGVLSDTALSGIPHHQFDCQCLNALPCSLTVNLSGNLRRHFFFSILLLTRLVVVTALLRRYLSSPHPLLQLFRFCSPCSPMFILSLSVANHPLLSCNSILQSVVNFIRPYLGRPNQLPGGSNRVRAKIHPLAS
jgi:hypothetical protein